MNHRSILLLVALMTAGAGLAGPVQAREVRTAEAAQDRLAEFIGMGDVRYDARAADGAPVVAVADPEDIEAGEAVIGGVSAALFLWQMYKTWHPELSDEGVWERVGQTAVAALGTAGGPHGGAVPAPQQQIEPGSSLLADDVEAARQLAQDVTALRGWAAEATIGWIVAQSPDSATEVTILSTHGGLEGGQTSSTELVAGGKMAAVADLSRWATREGAIAALSTFGPIDRPANSAGGRFGLIHTGLGDASAQGLIEQTIVAPHTRSATFAARYNFVTTEFPEYLGTEFNDSFIVELVHLQTGATEVLARFEGSLNQIFSESDQDTWRHVQFQSGTLPHQILDEAASGAGQTGWITATRGGINLQRGERYLVRFRVNDVGDRIFDSALLIDKASLR